jgi:hypothetical protein
MIRPGRERLAGVVEVDESYLGGDDRRKSMPDTHLARRIEITMFGGCPGPSGKRSKVPHKGVRVLAS